MEQYRLVDHGYPFKKIVVGRNWVGKVEKRDEEQDYEGIIFAGSIRVHAPTEREAFDAVVVQASGVAAGAPRERRERRQTIRPRIPTQIFAEQALDMLIEDYKAGRPTTTYGDLVARCGRDKHDDARWFGGVSQLIDAACVLANLPSFGLARIRANGGGINPAAWPKASASLRERIFANAERGSWTDDDFVKIKDALAELSARGLGPDKAAEYVTERVDVEAWAAATAPAPDAA